MTAACRRAAMVPPPAVLLAVLVLLAALRAGRARVPRPPRARGQPRCASPRAPGEARRARRSPPPAAPSSTSRRPPGNADASGAGCAVRARRPPALRAPVGAGVDLGDGDDRLDAHRDAARDGLRRSGRRHRRRWVTAPTASSPGPAPTCCRAARATTPSTTPPHAGVRVSADGLPGDGEPLENDTSAPTSSRCSAARRRRAGRRPGDPAARRRPRAPTP